MTEQRTAVVHEIVTELERLPDEKIVEVLDFVRFLREQFESGRPKHYAPRILNEAKWAELYADSAEEDQGLAETGLSDYAASLKTEDSDAKG